MKTKNVGFAKIEARNGQCRMSISVKGAYECVGRELTLYGYGKKNGEFILVPIGQIPVKNGVGEAVFGKKEDDLSGSGLGLTFLQGLFLRSGRHARKAYLTAWDDMLITISRLQQAPVAGEETEGQKPIAGEQAERQAPVTGKETEKQAEEPRTRQPEASEIPWGMREIRLDTGCAEEEKQELHKETGELRAAELELLKKEEKKQVSEEYVVTEHEENERKPDQPHEQAAVTEAVESEPVTGEAVVAEAAAAAEPAVTAPFETEAAAAEPAVTAPFEAEAPAAEPTGRMPDPFYFREGLTELPLWDSLKRIMPRKRVLSEEGWEVLQIQLQDLGRLPRENWPYGNNSFVLHGYYQYRYLILARRMREQKTPGEARWQYIVGVPGIFKPQEKFMAAMFGLPEFKRADSREENFGFWCGNVCMK
ncbi:MULTISPECIES: hypothetical protein [unclassified Candidatus Paralachnospira]|uniref:hypothetical protein n=1 Tax=unclassified Candidatus Paralachnospira TaxID=3099471 RepID=UPI003F938190